MLRIHYFVSPCCVPRYLCLPTRTGLLHGTAKLSVVFCFTMGNFPAQGGKSANNMP